jgi:Flp pilus assembly protein TadB
MSDVLVGAMAMALAVTSLALIPFGSVRVARASLAHPERSLLRELGWHRSLSEWESLRAATTLCGLLLAGAFGFAPLGLVGASAPSIVARVMVSRRRTERARETLPMLQMTVAGLRSGAGLVESLRLATASTRSTQAGPFAAAVRAFDLGAPLDVALHAARSEARDRQVMLGLDALSLCVAEQLPASRCVSLIASTVDRLVFEQRIVADVRARTAGLRVQIVLLAALVPGLALYLVLTVPGLADTFTRPLGRFVLLPAAAILETVGIIASRRVVSDIS